MTRRLGFVLIFLGAAVFVGAVFLWSNPRQQLFALTGEEGLTPQFKGLIQWAFRWTRPLPELADEVAVTYTDQVPFGVNTFLEQEVEPEKRERAVRMVTEAGFRWIRQSFPWYDIEIHGRGDFEDRRHEPARSAWEKYDQIVTLAEAYDLDIIARLEAPPAWSRHDGTERGAFGPPDDVQDFANYARAVVTRYQGRIRFYQVWNEPNIYPEWGHQPVDPEQYTELLCLVYQTIKEADPEAVVLSGALAPTVELGTWNPGYEGNNLMDTVFLQRMYNAGAQSCFDILAVNDYMLWSGPTDHRLRPTQVDFSRPLWVRDVMVANGDAAKPIWISEMNSNAAPEHIYPQFGRVTLEQQARYAPLAYERIQREWPWVGVATLWFFKRATDAERDQPMYYFRMVEPDFTPLPIYQAMSDYLNDLDPTLYPGIHQEDTWQVTYSGAWDEVQSDAASLDSYKRAGEAGASLGLHWEGHYITLIPGLDAEGYVHISKDDGPLQKLKLDGTPVTLACHLRRAHHTLTLTLDAGVVTVDEFQVR